MLQPANFIIPCGPGEGATMKQQLSSMFHIVAGTEQKGGFSCMYPKKSHEETLTWLQMHYTAYSVDGKWWQRPAEQDEDWGVSALQQSKISRLGAENAALKELIQGMQALLHKALPIAATYAFDSANAQINDWYDKRKELDACVKSLLGEEEYTSATH